MSPIPSTHLRDITSFPALVVYLADELDWPIDASNFDSYAFDWDAVEDLGVAPEHAARIRDIKQLRPLTANQPWGVFFIEFEPKKLPVGVLRRLLNKLVTKKRAASNPSDRQTWQLDDLLFVSAFGETTATREIAFAHFHAEEGDLPTLRVLGWDGDDTPLKLDKVEKDLANYLHWPEDEDDTDAWRSHWAGAFKHRLGHTIQTADMLAKVLAELARSIRDRCTTLIAAEPENGPLKTLFKAFQAALIHDLTEETFADTYAQTVTYGLLTAAISRTDRSGEGGGTFVQADNITDMVPVTNPFLKEMLQSFLQAGGRRGGLDFDELGVQDVVELLRDDQQTDLAAVLRDFGNRNPSEDPVIRFYEHFLAAYNKQLKIQRGVFYTPNPVVSYIVRSVHELLQTEFGLEDGLASTITWGEMIARNPEIKLPPLTDEPGEERTIDPGEFFVQVLDPATGTATFFVEVIDVIYKHLKAKWEKSGPASMPPISGLSSHPSSFDQYWNAYVPACLLPRIYAYELMMAPYAIAHMKIGLKLHETGYRFGSDERVRVYLTNALEPKVRQLPTIGFEALAHEAAAVNEVKWYKRFTVVIGNPPYAGHSSNKGPWVGGLLRDYYQVDGVPLDENNTKWLQDDYVKFIRLSQHLLHVSKTGILGLITNHGFMDNPTFRGMRKSLLDEFAELRLLDLHGNSKKKERSPDGSVDTNVFEIQQGVSITLGVAGIGIGRHNFLHAHLYGTRDLKYAALQAASATSSAWKNVGAVAPLYLFKPQDGDMRKEYSVYKPVNELMPVHSLGSVTARDALCIHFTKAEAWKTVEDFSAMKPEVAREHYKLGPDARDWQVVMAQADLKRSGLKKERLRRILYRPFDWRWTYFTGNSRGFHCMPRGEVMRHMIASPNIGLSTNRSIEVGEFTHVACANSIIGHHCVSLKEVNYLFPLWLSPGEGEFASERRPNISPAALRHFGKSTTPEDIFHYAYAVFHSPGYRSRYAEFLKIDFPRLPLTGNLELFRTLARLGGELTALHLLESPKLDDHITEFIGNNRAVSKIIYTDETVWIDGTGTAKAPKPGTSGFAGVPEDVWNFHIGGYQVCEKWLKDRGPKKGQPGRTLTDDDIAHYQKIVVALSETIRLMAEIDTVIESHGGFPAAFVTDPIPDTEDNTVNYPESPSELAMAAERDEDA